MSMEMKFQTYLTLKEQNCLFPMMSQITCRKHITTLQPNTEAH